MSLGLPAYRKFRPRRTLQRFPPRPTDAATGRISPRIFMSSATLTERVFNFSPGPAVLPLPVLEQAQRELVCLPGYSMSVLEMSHRAQGFLDILAAAKRLLRELLVIPDNYQIIFLQGGSRLQFSMIPMNLLRGQSQPADYV